MSSLTHCLLIAVVFLSTCPIALSQTKVGTGGDGILPHHTSVRCEGFASSGVSLVDANSYSRNPATLAVSGQKDQLSLTLYPVRAGVPDDDGGCKYFGASIGLGNKLRLPEKLQFGLAYYYSDKSYGEIVFTDRVGEVLGSRDVHIPAHNVCLSLAYSGRVKLGVGVTLRRYTPPVWSFSGSESSHFAFDLGFVASTDWHFRLRELTSGAYSRIRLTPSLGMVGVNLGPTHVVDHAQRVGFSLDISRDVGQLSTVNVLFNIEMADILPLDSDTTWVGLELGLAEILSIRHGVNNADGGRAPGSWGFTLSSVGATKILAGAHRGEAPSPEKGLIHKLAVELYYAKYADDTWGNRGRRFLSLTASYDL